MPSPQTNFLKQSNRTVKMMKDEKQQLKEYIILLLTQNLNNPKQREQG
jgi:hypothetical protein